jgi:hypothetical protein
MKSTRNDDPPSAGNGVARHGRDTIVEAGVVVGGGV